MAIKQLSIFVENREGTLVTVTDAIAKAGVDIRAMSVADTNDFGIFRLIDMANTTFNVTGDIVTTMVVARSEGMMRDPATGEMPQAKVA